MAELVGKLSTGERVNAEDVRDYEELKSGPPPAPEAEKCPECDGVDFYCPHCSGTGRTASAPPARDERTPRDGKPFYCKTCGLGWNEYGACEETDCRLESGAEAKARASAPPAANGEVIETPPDVYEGTVNLTRTRAATERATIERALRPFADWDGVERSIIERCAKVAEAYPTEPPFGDVYTADNLVRHGQDCASKDIAKFIRALAATKEGSRDDD